MKKMLRIFQVIGIVSLVTLITAVSCGKKGGGGNSGGGATIVVTNVLATNVTSGSLGGGTVANPVKVDGTDISIKISAFLNTSVGSSTNFDDVLTEVDPDTSDNSLIRRKVFDFALGGASGGLMLVAPGNVASVGDFEAPALATTVPADNAGNEGVFLVTVATESGFVAQGLNVYGVFMNTDATATYAFSDARVDIGQAKNKFYCRAVVPEITTTTPAATATLKGGEKSECFISYYGYTFPGTDWLANATRKTIEIAVGAVRTDGKNLSEMGFGNAAEFSGGLSKADMAKLAGANKAAYKKYKVTIVADDAF